MSVVSDGVTPNQMDLRTLRNISVEKGGTDANLGGARNSAPWTPQGMDKAVPGLLELDSKGNPSSISHGLRKPRTKQVNECIHKLIGAYVGLSLLFTIIGS